MGRETILNGAVGLFFLFTPVGIYSQDYIPTLGEGKEWELSIVDAESQTYKAYYFTACDTVIQGLTYKSIIRKSDSQVIAYTREDVEAQHVYYLPLDLSPEILVVDYSLEEGDTFILRGYPTIVESVNVETKFGAERTVIHFPGGIEFIEGVGHSWYGVLNSFLEGFFNSVTGVEDNQATCEQITLTSEHLFDEIIIFPNPVINELYLKTGDVDLDNLPMTLTTMEGMQIERWIFQYKPVDVAHLAGGIYFLRIANRTFKVIKL